MWSTMRGRLPYQRAPLDIVRADEMLVNLRGLRLVNSNTLTSVVARFERSVARICPPLPSSFLSPIR